MSIVLILSSDWAIAKPNILSSDWFLPECLRQFDQGRWQGESRGELNETVHQFRKGVLGIKIVICKISVEEQPFLIHYLRQEMCKVKEEILD